MIDNRKPNSSPPLLAFFRHEALENLNCGVTHGIFNRFDGVSAPPYDSLNLSFNVGDLPENVHTNREKVKEALDIDLLVSAGQVHSSNILVVEENPGHDMEVKGYDALVTNVSEIFLLVQLADCQSVMLFDPVRKVAANIHCGWRGNVADIIGKTISTMEKRFLCRPGEILAVISPSLGPCCAEFKNYHLELPLSFHDYQVSRDHFDFWSISSDQLRAAGVRKKNIHLSSICTKCNPEWFSYRRQRETGRFGTIIGFRTQR